MNTVKQGKFAEQVKYERELRGWSQAKMAQELQTTPNRISTWERNLAMPSAYFRQRLCELFEKDAEELGLLQGRREEGMEPVCEERPSVGQQEDHVEPVLREEVVEESSAWRGKAVEGVASRARVWLRGRSGFVAIVSTVVVVLAVMVSLVVGYVHPGESNPYVAGAGRLMLNDALHDQSGGIGWQEGVNEHQASCTFKGGAYTVFQPMTGYFHACIAQRTDYQNFVYEVGMTIESGDFGGIVFRAEDGVDAHYYLFRVQTDGSYLLYRFMDNSIEHAVLLDQGMSRVFNRGLGGRNVLGVVAQGDELVVYVNHVKVTSVRDAGYTHGAIGVLAGSLESGSGEAVFSDAKVWVW